MAVKANHRIVSKPQRRTLSDRLPSRGVAGSPSADNSIPEPDRSVGRGQQTDGRIIVGATPLCTGAPGVVLGEHGSDKGRNDMPVSPASIGHGVAHEVDAHHRRGCDDVDPKYPKYAPLPKWGAISGLGRSKSYELLGDGKLRAIKVGRRLLIDVEHGLEYLATMPTAVIRQARSRKPP